MLVFYTDGFSEAMNAHKELYGDTRLAQRVSEVGQRTASEILRAVSEDVHHFMEAAGRHDDMTMVVIKLRSRASVPAGGSAARSMCGSLLPGEVDRHFWDRFGAAILVSVIDGAVQAAVQRESRGNSVIVNPAGSTDIMTEVLKSTIHIPPTVTKPHGDRIAVLVARDLDFRSVYELRTGSAR